MINISKFTFLLLVIILGVGSYAHALEVKDSAKIVIAGIDKAFQSKKISEDLYLDSVQKTMQLLQSSNLTISKDELLELLTVYREVIWGNKKLKKFQQHYYAILSGQARLEGRNGEMLYYAQKQNELERLNGNAYSVNSIFSIVNYYYGKYKYAQAAAFYPKYKEFLNGLPGRAANKELERRDLMRSGDLLGFLCMASYHAKDTLQGQEIERLLKKLEDSIKKTYPGDKEIFIRLQYSIITANGEKRRSLNDQAETWKSILQLDSLLLDPNTPDYLKGHIEFNIRDSKTLFFLDHPNNDSAARYIDLMKSMPGFISSASNAYMVKKYDARLLYNKGLYKASEDTLIQALIMLEAINATTSEEVDDLIYTLTKVEDQQLLLNDAAAENKGKEQLIRWVSFVGILIVVAGIGSFLFIRQRQKRKFLEFKLNMARNVHDETGPALLYAKSLARSCKVIGEDENMRAELESHIENTMAVIRSLSHDLRSDKLYSVSSLVKEIDNILKKLKNLNVFNYDIKEQLKEDRFISHYQFSQLKAVLQECITNSIKHAQFDHIDISFIEAGNKLTITYSDNGSGWDRESYTGGGIGMNNIKERVRSVNGDLNINNDFPKGYSIQIRVPLR